LTFLQKIKNEKIWYSFNGPYSKLIKPIALMHPIIDNLILGPLKYLKKIIINQIKIERKKRRKMKRRKRIKEEKKTIRGGAKKKY